MTKAFRNWQLVVGALVAACGAPQPQPGPVDSGLPAAEDAGVDAGLADAGTVLQPVWRQVASTPVASGLWGSVLTFDPMGRRFIMHGGNTYPAGSVVNDTWAYDIAANAWSQLTTQGDTPPLRYCHCAAFLPTTRQVLIAGGRDAMANVNTAYTLDLATLTWTQVQGPTPAGAIGCTAQWMPSLGKAIVFGGDGPQGVNARTWAFDPATRAFTELAVPSMPAARRDAMHAYDSQLDRLILFGGARQIRSAYLDDLAFFNGTTWANPTPQGTHPSPRRYGASGMDEVHGRWLLFGGTNDLDDFGDLWVIDPVLVEFTRADVAGSPAARAFTASGVDAPSGTLYLFGGLEAASFTARSEGWAVSLELR